MTPWTKKEPLTEGAEWWERVLAEPSLRACLVRANEKGTWFLGIVCGEDDAMNPPALERAIPHRDDRQQMLAHCDILIAEWLQGLICEVTAPTEVVSLHELCRRTLKEVLK